MQLASSVGAPVTAPVERPIFWHLRKVRQRASTHFMRALATRDWQDASSATGTSASSRSPPIVACSSSTSPTAARASASGAGVTPNDGVVPQAIDTFLSAASILRASCPDASVTRHVSAVVARPPDAKRCKHFAAIFPCALPTFRTALLNVAMQVRSADVTCAPATPRMLAIPSIASTQTVGRPPRVTAT